MPNIVKGIFLWLNISSRTCLDSSSQLQIFKSQKKTSAHKFLIFKVHPCGRYRHNTVVFILAKEHGLKNLRTIHRLDRLTSGLLLFGRNPKKAREMEQQIRTRQVQKEYVCRVEGEFPM